MRCQRCSLSASASVALRTVLGHVASSVKSVWRAHNSYASRCPASEATVFICRFSASDPRLRTRPAEGLRARSIVLASVFGQLDRSSASRGSFPPNKSFKPTPHRGVNSVLYATLHAVATPPWGGLTPALGGRKAFSFCMVRIYDSSASPGTALRKFLQSVCSSAKFVGRAQASHALRSPASEAVIGFR